MSEQEKQEKSVGAVNPAANVATAADPVPAANFAPPMQAWQSLLTEGANLAASAPSLSPSEYKEKLFDLARRIDNLLNYLVPTVDKLPPNLQTSFAMQAIQKAQRGISAGIDQRVVQHTTPGLSMT